MPVLMLVVPIYCPVKESTIIQHFNPSIYPVTYPSTDLPTHLFTYLPSAYGPTHIAIRQSIQLYTCISIHSTVHPSVFPSFMLCCPQEAGLVTHMSQRSIKWKSCVLKDIHISPREKRMNIMSTQACDEMFRGLQSEIRSLINFQEVMATSLTRARWDLS